MAYEVLFQPIEAGAAFDPAPLEAALSTKQVPRRPDGAWVWKLSSGEVELRPVLEGGKPVAYALAVPYADRDTLIREAVGAAAELGTAAGLRVVDPVLGRAIRLEDEGAVLESFLSASRYAGEFRGEGGAVGLSSTRPLEDEGMSTGVRVMLALVVFVVCVFLGWRLLVG